MPMIEMQEEEYSYSDFSDTVLLQVSNILGPAVKDALLLPGEVPIEVKGAVYAPTGSD